MNPMIFLILFFSLSGFSDELSRPGLTLYQDHKYSEALIQFEKQLKNNPKDGLIWFSKAKTMYALLKKKDELFGCIEENTVGFKILHALSEAVENDMTAVNKELEKNDPVFADFKKTTQFQKWLIAIKLFKPLNDSKAFISKNPYWLPSSNEDENWNTSFEFKPNGDVFKAKLNQSGKKITQYQFEKDGSLVWDKKKYVLKPIKIYFNSGNYYFFVASLEGDENYILGPKSSSQCDDSFNY
jgi:hypothetical protein